MNVPAPNLFIRALILFIDVLVDLKRHVFCQAHAKQSGTTGDRQILTE